MQQRYFHIIKYLYHFIVSVASWRLLKTFDLNYFENVPWFL